MAPILKVTDAQRIFATPEGGSVRALDGVSLDVNENEFVTLLGPSGCGKTTLLRAIAGFEELDGGTIKVDGADMNGVPPFRRPVNTVFQSYALFSHMSVARNVGYSLEIAGVAKDERAAQVAEQLELVGLKDMGGRKPSQLSGGQRQRVALARSLIAKPKILLLDEPLSALDRQLRQQMQVELKNLQDEIGISFVFVTHDQEEALTMSDRIVVMRAGQIEQIDPPRAVYRQPKTRFVADFIGDSNMIDVVCDGAGFAKSAGGISLAVSNTAAKGPATAVVRPADLMITGDDATRPDVLRGVVKQEIYLGSELHYIITLDASGSDLRITARDDGKSYAKGDKITLCYDPNSIHLIAGQSDE
ncbi:MAG: ABC transporter ATP-binding protein [Sulfitobacter sp.]